MVALLMVAVAAKVAAAAAGVTAVSGGRVLPAAGTGRSGYRPR